MTAAVPKWSPTFIPIQSPEQPEVSSSSRKRIGLGFLPLCFWLHSLRRPNHVLEFFKLVCLRAREEFIWRDSLELVCWILGFLSTSLENSVSCNVVWLWILVGFCSAGSHCFVQYSRAVLCEEYLLSTFSIAMLKVSSSLHESGYLVSRVRAWLMDVLDLNILSPNLKPWVWESGSSLKMIRGAFGDFVNTIVVVVRFRFERLLSWNLLCTLLWS